MYTNTHDLNNLYNNVYSDIVLNCSYEHDGNCHSIPYSIIVKLIKHIKRGKNDGLEGLSSDYFCNGTPLLFECISLVFPCMILHSFSPLTFCISTIITIHKGSNL